jgi:hypothetical protein
MRRSRSFAVILALVCIVEVESSCTTVQDKKCFQDKGNFSAQCFQNFDKVLTEFANVFFTFGECCANCSSYGKECAAWSFVVTKPTSTKPSVFLCDLRTSVQPTGPLPAGALSCTTSKAPPPSPAPPAGSCADEKDCNAVSCADCACVNLKCKCSDGWSGSHCMTPLCSNRASCSSHGDCVRANEHVSCRCDAGYTGPLCQTKSCALKCKHGGAPNAACTACTGCLGNTQYLYVSHIGLLRSVNTYFELRAANSPHYFSRRCLEWRGMRSLGLVCASIDSALTICRSYQPISGDAAEPAEVQSTLSSIC